MRVLEVNTVINKSSEELWGLLNAPKNVLDLAPKWLHVELSGDRLDEMYQGQKLFFTLRPFRILKMSWVTEIIEIFEGKYFVDSQIGGPFKFWRHEHIIKIEKGQTILLDRLTFQTNLSWLPGFDRF
jgi:ligand-binding SRPBCC domain-containing protein